jgi:hypothetical protein
MAITTFEFVLLDPQSNPKPGKTSSQIRSRCMQGKNKRDGSRRSRREGKKFLEDRITEVESGTQGHGARTQALARTDLLLQTYGLIAHPRSAGLDVQLDPVQAFAYDLTNRSLSPFECCIDFESMAGHMVPFEKLQSDELFVHSIIVAGYALRDFSRKSPSPTQQTMWHLQTTLSLLRVKLQSPFAYQEESIIHAVLNLAMLAGGFSQWTATIVHLNGLQRIIRLRGGAEFLAKWPKLQLKLGR